MPTIYDFIYIENTPSMEVTNEKDKALAMEVAGKLQHLEPEILKQPDGKIILGRNGQDALSIVYFSRDLSDKILESIRDRSN